MNCNSLHSPTFCTKTVPYCYHSKKTHAVQGTVAPHPSNTAQADPSTAPENSFTAAALTTVQQYAAEMAALTQRVGQISTLNRELEEKLNRQNMLVSSLIESCQEHILKVNLPPTSNPFTVNLILFRYEKISTSDLN